MKQFFSKINKVQWIVFSIALLIYINTVPNKWAIDDSVIIYQNKFVQRGVSGIPDIMSKDAFAGKHEQDLNAVIGGRYRPMSIATFAIQAELFAKNKIDEKDKVVKDKKGNPLKDLGEKTIFPHILHFFNALWYALLCLVIYRTLHLLFHSKQEVNPVKADFLALATTLIYTVHPLHTEAVANVKGLDEILVMLGSVATLYFVLKQFKAQQDNQAVGARKYILLAIASYAFALFSKESAVTFIAVIPLALWFFTPASFKNIFTLTLPLLLPLILFLGARSAVLNQPHKGDVSEELMNDPFLVLNPKSTFAPLVKGSDIKILTEFNEDTYTKMPFSNQLATNFYSWGKYFQLLIAPHPLTIDYYPRYIAIKSFKDISVIFSVLIHLILIGWTIFHIRKKHIIAFGILYYFITFSIVSNLFFPIGTSMAERFMFMPSLGFCMILASLLYQLGVKWSRNQDEKGFKFIYLGLGALIMVFSTLTINRNFDWKDNFTLFSKDVEVSKNSGKIHTDLAAELISKANQIKEEKELATIDLSVERRRAALKDTEVERAELFKRSTTLLKKAIEIHPTYNIAWLGIGNAYHFLGEMESNNPNINLTLLNTALAAYEQAYKYKGTGMDTILTKFQSLCLMDIGKLMGEKFGDINSCISFLEKANVLDDENPELYLLLGTAYSMKQDFEKSIANTLKSLELRPDDRDTKKNLATAYQQYAYTVPSKKEYLTKAEKLLLDLYSEEKTLPNNHLLKKESLFRTLDLLIKNYTIQGNIQMVTKFQLEIQKLN